MPRKYRPPATRRRKTKRQAPYYVEPLPDSGGEALATDGATVVTDDADAQSAAAESVAYREPDVRETRPAERASSPATKHIAKDYGYVRAEVRRIAIVGGFLIIALIITAVLRS